jgi:hypothetical protein
MPRRERPPKTSRSEHWMRVAVNEHAEMLNSLIRQTFGWHVNEEIEWLSPVAQDEYAEYFDEAFLDRLGVSNIPIELDTFWPARGPRWDGLAKTASGKRILVEAKAHVEEMVHHGSRATDPNSLQQISASLARTKDAFKAASDLQSWMTPFYQYTNRLAHLYFLRQLKGIDAYLIFLFFANAPDVSDPCSADEFRGAERLISKCLGLPRLHPFAHCTRSLILDVRQITKI